MTYSIRKTVVAAVAALGMATALASMPTPAEAQFHGGGGGFHGGGFHGGGFEANSGHLGHNHGFRDHRFRNRGFGGYDYGYDYCYPYYPVYTGYCDYQY